MKWLDAALGRSKPTGPDLDRLFGIPDAAITTMQDDLEQLLDADGGPKVEVSNDKYGFTWLLVRHDPADVPGLVTELHAVNSTLQDNGFGPALLCSLMGFTASDGRRLALVYLSKRGTFYPFAPSGPEQRDTALELQVRSAIAEDLHIEPDLARWVPVWGAPGL